MNNVLLSRKSDERYTPNDFYSRCNQEVWWFDLDVCATKENTKTNKYYTIDDDWLSKIWFWKVWCNPPYSKLKQRVKKCSEQTNNCDLIYLLIPARTDTIAFHEYIYNKDNVEIRFIKWRLRFWWCKDPAPFPSMLVIFKR